MRRLTIAEKKAQIQRIIDYNVDDNWTKKERMEYFARLDMVRGIAFGAKLMPLTIEYDRYRRLAIKAIKLNNGEIKFDKKTLEEFEMAGEDIEDVKSGSTILSKKFKGAILSIISKLKSFKERIFGKTKLLGEGKSKDGVNSQTSSTPSERDEFVDGLRVEQSRDSKSQGRSDKPKKREKKPEKKPEKDRDE